MAVKVVGTIELAAGVIVSNAAITIAVKEGGESLVLGRREMSNVGAVLNTVGCARRGLLDGSTGTVESMGALAIVVAD